MKYSGIGGQAVMEGVMMKNQDTYAVAVRKENGEIVTETKEYKGIIPFKAIQKIPIIRGVLNFIDSLYLGMSSLMFSAQFFEEEEPSKEEKTDGMTETESEPEEPKEKTKKQERQEAALMGGTVAFSVVIAVAIFMVLPYFLSRVFSQITTSEAVITIAEGVLRLVIFFGYLLLISRMKDIQRVFMYHGAEHKCINCIEHGMELNVENVRASSRQHKRCGTNFLFIVMIITIIFFSFIHVDSHVLRIVYRLVLIPIIAGVSYEFLRIAGRYDNAFVDLLNKPGMMLQKLTTREPSDDMIEVGIASIEAVFDWKSYIEAEQKED